jgi:hypothetical protein
MQWARFKVPLQWTLALLLAPIFMIGCPILGMSIGATLGVAAAKLGFAVLVYPLFASGIVAGLATGPICYGKLYRYLATRMWRRSE